MKHVLNALVVGTGVFASAISSADSGKSIDCIYSFSQYSQIEICRTILPATDSSTNRAAQYKISYQNGLLNSSQNVYVSGIKISDGSVHKISEGTAQGFNNLKLSLDGNRTGSIVIPGGIGADRFEIYFQTATNKYDSNNSQNYIFQFQAD